MRNRVIERLNRINRFQFEGLDIFGFRPRNFDMCPGAVATFEHLISMPVEEDTLGMIRSAAIVADEVFRIEKEAIQRGSSTEEELLAVIAIVDDFKDIIHEIDEESGMIHDVSYMDGHIEKVRELLK